jgi:hypothetical protein
MSGTAVFSPDGVYRYVLTRRWAEDAPSSVLWIMLNPSTATAEKNDPTIKRCIDFTAREGYAALTVVNVFAYRATNPKELMRVADPIGPDNRAHIVHQLADARHGLIIGAWGGNGPAIRLPIKAMADDAGRTIMCFGVTASAQPVHPLYQSGDTPLVEWKG